MSDPHKQFFGDGTYAMALTPALISELERVTGTGIGAITQRLFNRSFAYADVTETIRLALIGGGMTAERAKELTDTYVPSTPLVESQNVAVAILQRLWLGEPKNEIISNIQKDEADGQA